MGMDIGFKVDIKKEREREQSDTTITEVNSEQNRNSYSGKYADQIPADFLEKSKKAFEIIFEAYAEGDKETLKELLSPKLWKAFCMAIDDRNSRGEKLEGILVRFVRVDIEDITVRSDETFVRVKFVTEQSNVLKDRMGTIIEGNSDFVENRIDNWVFSRKESSNNATWHLMEINEA